ncbi:MAG: tRNA (N(6)-L-threonylcarbamoyladenosine(37)-C(2))-methylthiotransferase MtaB [Desulfuromonadales bacterium]|nr:tRNA (N(6)-L-threonylcarbamoyladenosine(37)-C(2))-methylthiotransferase MtaB [Desulfuromonadales bacterium]
MKTVAIATLGCKTNQFETATMIEQFRNAGYSMVAFTEAADIYVINSCTVTARTDAETRRLIRRARRLNPEARIVATGCYAQVAPDELSRMPEVDVVLGNREKLDSMLVAGAVENRVGNIDTETELSPLQLTSFAEHTRAFLQVQNGCNSFCSYCIVPFARGRSRSVAPGEVLDGIRRLVENGFREVVLTGIHLGAYGLDLSPADSLEGLIRRILDATELPRLRIGSVDPNEFSDSLITLCASSPAICHHFHIPLQSGCDSVLQRMGRPYDSAYFQELMEKIITVMPHAFIGSDIIAGFPGETDQEFEATCSLIEALPLADLHVFPYSKRPRTEAANMPGHLQPFVVNQRAARLRLIAKNKNETFLAGAVGREIRVLGQQVDETTGIVRGISREYIQAEFPGSPADLNVERTVLVTALHNGRALCQHETEVNTQKPGA